MIEYGIGEVRISSARASNDKFALVQRTDGHIELYTVDGHHLRTLPRAIRSDTQPVFSRTSLDHLFTVEPDQRIVWRHDIANDESEIEASFPEFTSLATSHAEGDLTPDGWLAICGVDPDGTEHAFVYNVETGERGDTRQFRTGEVDGLKAAKGGWLLVSGESGIHAYPLVGPRHPVAAANGHACTAVYQGRPVLLWCNSAESGILNPAFANAVEIIDIADPGTRRALKSFDWAYAMHISGEIVSVYDPPNGPHTKGLPFQIWRCPFDGSTPKLLHEWHGPYNKLYQPRASVSADGRHVSFNVWDGQQCKVYGRTTDVVDAAEPVPSMPTADRLELLDYRPFNGERFRLVIDMLVVDGVLTTESTKMYRRHS